MKNLFVYILAILILSSCASTGEVISSGDPYGFWSGLWHGIIAPFTFIGSLFMDDVAVYAVDNTGGWYDFGFLLGVGGFAKNAHLTYK